VLSGGFDQRLRVTAMASRRSILAWLAGGCAAARVPWIGSADVGLGATPDRGERLVVTGRGRLSGTTSVVTTDDEFPRRAPCDDGAQMRIVQRRAARTIAVASGPKPGEASLDVSVPA